MNVDFQKKKEENEVTNIKENKYKAVLVQRRNECKSEWLFCTHTVLIFYTHEYIEHVGETNAWRLAEN